MSVNKVILLGNVGKDPEVRHLESGSMKASFTLATSDQYKNKSGEIVKQTEWHNIVARRGLAEISDKYIKKGSQIYVEGKLTNRSYDDKDGVKRYICEIVADTIQLLGKKESQAGESTYEKPAEKESPKEENTPKQEDDLPF